MGKIRRLGDDLVNQIAAGEVVERPASVAKELIENALDAGASRVDVGIELGGVGLVRVTDDGEGMTREDALLCLERHATSKIARMEDFASLASFGFRGEALPSIASVARLTLRTRQPSQREGCEIQVEGGRVVANSPSGGATGTTVSVTDLFYNVPARRKFLKATATESAHVGEVLVGTALARPEVAFAFSRDGRIVREYLRASSRAERGRSVLHDEELAHCTAQAGATTIEALLGLPERARLGATGLSLLINGRPVRDRALARAVAQAYGSVLEAGRYPVGVVWLDMPPRSVDVNVHPQKSEVRFENSRSVFDTVTRELHAQLASTLGSKAVGAHPYATRMNTSHSFIRDSQSPSSTLASPPMGALPPTNLFATDQVDLFATESLYGKLRYVGQVRGTFLLCEGGEALYIIDQHAAAERLAFDRLRRAYAEQNVQVQRLLVPSLVELTAHEVESLDDNQEVARLGIELRAAGDTTIAVHGVPALLTHCDPGRLATDLAAQLGRASGRSFENAIDLVLATMACHGSLRAGDRIEPEEAEALLQGLDGVDFRGHCPHGRPVLMRLGWDELERRVGR